MVAVPPVAVALAANIRITKEELQIQLPIARTAEAGSLVAKELLYVTVNVPPVSTWLVLQSDALSVHLGSSRVRMAQRRALFAIQGSILARAQ